MTFTDSSTDPDGQITARAWDTDDDGAFDNGTGASAQATFASSGTYTVRLQVTDDKGAPAVASVPVVVQAAGGGGGGGGVTITAGNLTQNAGFEAGITRWSCYHCTLAQATLADAPEGTKTAQITLGAGFTSMALDDSPDTISSTMAGAAYTGRAYVKAADAGSVGKTVRLYLREKDSTGAVVKDTAGTAVTLSSTFTPITVTATALAAARKMDVRVGMSSIAVPTSIYIDAVSVVQGSGAPPADNPPVASFTVSASPTAGSPVTFTDSSTDPDGQITARAWDTDDDGAFDNGTGASAQATFASSGTYTVRLQVTDDKGAPAVASVPVVVQAAGGGGGGGGVTIPAGNLTQNAGFEAGITRWSCYHCTLAQATLADAPEGTKTAQITLGAGFTSMALDDSPDTISSTMAGAAYTGRAYVKAADAGSVGKTVRLYLREKDSTGAVVKDTAGTAVTLSSTFTPITVTATALAAARKMDVRVGMSSIAVPTSIYIDAVSVVPG